ncbi:DNA pilot protein [Microvirus sp.]|nr:DNA pilot protein [Microvirus sp.]
MGLFDAITGGIGLGLGYTVGWNQSKKMAEKQHEYNKETMAIQNTYNKEMAAIAQQYNKDLWNYTNYENQVKHLKAAGLNPALLYGKGGGGGASAAGASPMGISAVGGNEVAAGGSYMSSATQMGIGLADIMANMKLKETQAEANKAGAAKDNAEAAKLSGVDTQLAQAQEKLANAKTDTEKTLQMLNTWNTEEKKKAIEATNVEIQKGNAELRSLLTQAYVNEQTKDVLVDQRLQDLQNTINNGWNIMAETAKTRQEEKYFQAMEQQGWAKLSQLAKQIANGEITAEAALIQAEKYAEDVANRYDLGKKQIDLGYWNMGVNGVLEATKIATDFIPKPAKIINKITETKKD